jgi:NtrC-family two-component system response regulator AlgB
MEQPGREADDGCILPRGPLRPFKSELFGHAKESFTGAVKENPGRIAACEGGTLFLDEIGDMAFTVQAKLLRFIQDKKYERLGDTKTRISDVRIIAATNADLEKRVTEGSFREDLYYRLNEIRLTIPPLRERSADILPMAYNFLESRTF